MKGLGTGVMKTPAGHLKKETRDPLGSAIFTPNSRSNDCYQFALEPHELQFGRRFFGKLTNDVKLLFGHRLNRKASSFLQQNHAFKTLNTAQLIE